MLRLFVQKRNKNTKEIGKSAKEYQIIHHGIKHDEHPVNHLQIGYDEMIDLSYLFNYTSIEYKT